MIPIYQPSITELEKRYVNECLDSGWISSRGSFIERFEDNLSKYLNVEYVSTCSNGTVSIMLALAALGVKAGDEVLCPSLTYAASASPALWLGCKLVLFDSDWNLQPSFQSFYKSLSKRTRVLILPELYGDSPDLEPFLQVCKERDIIVIEDSAEVFGCTYKDKYLGTFGDVGSFSFFGNKVITGGELGAVVCHDQMIAERIKILKSQSHIGNFIHDGPGFNFRATNIQCAIATAQLERIDWILENKKRVADYYRSHIKDPFVVTYTNSNVKSSEWMPLFMMPVGMKYEQLYLYMQDRGIDTRPCFMPIHLQPNWTFEVKDHLTTSSFIYSRGFNLPSYPDLTNKQLEYITSTLNGIPHGL